MGRLNRLASGCRALLRGGGEDRELDAELAAYLDASIEDKVRAGMSQAEARRAALVEIGGLESVKERTREVSWDARAESLWRDLHYAARNLRRSPGFTAVAVLTLALGIGANTAIFSVVNGVLLRPLPYAASDRIVRVLETIAPREGSGAAPRTSSPLPAGALEALRARSQTLQHIGIHLPVFWTLTEGGESTWAVGARVSPAVLHAFAVSPVVGRLFDDGDERSGREAVVLLSHRMWRQRYGADAAALGRTVTLEGRGYTVVGVMPPDFRFPDANTDYWVPFVVQRDGPQARARLPLTVRVRDEVSLDMARAELATLLPQVRGEEGKVMQSPLLTLSPLRELIAEPIRPALLVLFGAVSFVLVIACINVANLLLARSQSRQREHAVRVALGATRGRLVQQSLIESVLLAVTGGGAGLLLAFGGLQLLRALASGLARRDVGPSTALPRLEELAIDRDVWLFTMALCLLTSVLFGLAPALRASVARPRQLLQDARVTGVPGAGVMTGFGGHGVLVVLEVTLATVLLVGAGLLSRSFANLTTVDLGFDAADVLTFQLALPPGRSEAELKALGERVAERLRAVESVASVGYTETLPMIPSGRMVPLRFTPEMPPPGRAPGLGPDRPDLADGRVVSRDYLRAMGIRLVEGRGFEDGDRAGAARALLINERLARSGFLGPQPIGRQVYALGREPYEVVGVFADVRHFNVSRDPEQQVLMDFRQVSEPLNLSFGLYFALRVQDGGVALASGLRDVVRQVDPRAMVENVSPMGELVAHSTSRQRLYAVLMSVFASLAVVLAAIGIYGVLSYAVIRRTREIGIRMALGARSWAAVGGVARQAAVLVAIGLACGLAGAMAASRVLDGLLFGLTTLDPSTFAGALVLFTIVAALAVAMPAYRATHTDPVIALRCE